MGEGRPDQSSRFNPRTRPVVPPIHQSVTYFLDDEAYKDIQAGGLDEIWYGRFRNPTVDVAAEEVRRLEGSEAAFMTASGMGAIALAARDDVVRVRHPSLSDYERADIAARVLRRDGGQLRAGAMVSFSVAGGDERALRGDAAAEDRLRGDQSGGMDGTSPG